MSCDCAKFLAARLSGKDAPQHPDTERTLDEARARIQTCLAYLETFQAKDFEGAETRLVELAHFEGKVLKGSEYLVGLALPNLYFHVTTAYALLRHNGVDVGKRDFIGALPLQDR